MVSISSNVKLNINYVRYHTILDLWIFYSRFMDRIIKSVMTHLTFIGPCIVMYSYSTTNKIHLFLKLFIIVKGSTCFGRSFPPSSGAQNCIYGNSLMSNSCCHLLLASSRWQQLFDINLLPYVQFWAPDDGRKDCAKHVERFTIINNLRNRCILLVIL